MTTNPMHEPCELHEIIGCQVCSGKAKRQEQQAQEPSHPFLARYDGECARCEGRIEAGRDGIVMIDGRAVHEVCS